MSHGKKKFIETYDGRIKRSNDRTTKDYYGDLKWWDEWSKYGFARRKPSFCPQCKHVRKPILAEEAAWKKRQMELRAMYEEEYGEAEKVWKEYRKTCWLVVRINPYLGAPLTPKVPEPPHFWQWATKNYPEYMHRWDYDIRSYLCYKCEVKYEKKHEMWSNPYPGRNRTYQGRRKQDWKDYKNDVKAVMQKAKYDEELYDDIPVYKHGWLD